MTPEAGSVLALLEPLHRLLGRGLLLVSVGVGVALAKPLAAMMGGLGIGAVLIFEFSLDGPVVLNRRVCCGVNFSVLFRPL